MESLQVKFDETWRRSSFVTVSNAFQRNLVQRFKEEEPREQRLRKMTSSTDLRRGSVSIKKVSEMINREFKALGRKYAVLLNFWTCCRELRGAKLLVFAHAYAFSALSEELRCERKVLSVHAL